MLIAIAGMAIEADNAFRSSEGWSVEVMFLRRINWENGVLAAAAVNDISTAVPDLGEVTNGSAQGRFNCVSVLRVFFEEYLDEALVRNF